MASPTRMRAAILIAVTSLWTTGLAAQTAVKLPKNRFTPQQDVELGRQGAAEAHGETANRHRRVLEMDAAVRQTGPQSTAHHDRHVERRSIDRRDLQRDGRR